MRKLFVILIALAVLVVGGSWFYIKVIEGDPADKLTIDDTAGASAARSADDGKTAGTWKATKDSIVGYRVKETLFGASNEAVGRTSDVDGTMEINGTSVTSVQVTVDMTTVSSDRSQRDGQFRGRIMNTAQFPTATFTLTEPIALSSLNRDKQIDAKATGSLTLHGVTRRVTFDVVAKRVTGSIRVNGAIPIHFDDYGISNPSGGPAQVGDDGTLEFTLVFAR